MGDYAARRASARLPLDAPVGIRYPGLEQEFEERARNLGMTGMFVSGETPMPPGTLMHFELRPTPEWRRLKGTGRVLWARHEPNSEGEPPGMGVRFVDLEDRGRRGIRWLVETYQQAGGMPLVAWSTPARFRRLAAGADDVPRSAAPPRTSGPNEGRRNVLPLWPWLAAAGIALLALVWLLSR